MEEIQHSEQIDAQVDERVEKVKRELITKIIVRNTRKTMILINSEEKEQQKKIEVKIF